MTHFPVESETAEPRHAQNRTDRGRARTGLSPDSYTHVFLHTSPREREAVRNIQVNLSLSRPHACTWMEVRRECSCIPSLEGVVTGEQAVHGGSEGGLPKAEAEHRCVSLGAEKERKKRREMAQSLEENEECAPPPSPRVLRSLRSGSCVLSHRERIEWKSREVGNGLRGKSESQALRGGGVHKELDSERLGVEKGRAETGFCCRTQCSQHWERLFFLC